MPTEEEILRLIYGAIDEVNASRPAEERFEATVTSILYGDDGLLDSLALVSLIVLTEDLVNDAFDTALTLADARAMSMERSPFRTVGSFAAFIVQRLEEERSPGG